MARLLFILAVTVMGMAACSTDRDLLIKWSDPEADLTVSVVEGSTVLKANSYLIVQKDGITTEELIDDDAIFSEISLLRIEEWILVLNHNEVWAGYNIDSEELFGEYDWTHLPFTVHESGGTVLKKVNLGRQSTGPVRWIKVKQSESKQVAETNP